MSTSTIIDTVALNAQFTAMTPAEKRRAIANDVLARLDAKQLVPTPQRWVTIPTYLGEERDLQTILHLHPEVPCNVCAIGAAIVGLAHFVDEVELKPSGGHEGLFVSLSAWFAISPQHSAHLRLIDVFGQDQLLLIERAFEGKEADLPGQTEMPEAERQRCYAYRDRSPKAPADLFRAIWESIAAHPEGLFVP